MSTSTLVVQPVKVCPVCGSELKSVVYEDVRDHKYQVPGQWRFVQCLDCSLIYLDPRLEHRDIGKAYPAAYTQHKMSPQPDINGSALKLRLRRAVLSACLGYTCFRASVKALEKVLA